MKKILTLVALMFAEQLTSQAQCNTIVTQVTPTSTEQEFAVVVTANKLSNGLYPAILELKYEKIGGGWDYDICGGGYIGNTQIGYDANTNFSTSFFYNIATTAQVYARTTSVVIDQLDPSNPYYAMTLQQIYDLISGDPTKWCTSSPITISFTNPITTLKQKGKGNPKK